MKHEIDRILDAANALMERRQRGVFVTAIATSGSTYRRAGARAVIAEDGSSFGLISGGCVERDLAAHIQPWLEDFKPRLITYDSTAPSDIVFGTGLGCRGTIEMLIEPFDATHPPPMLTGFRWNGRTPVTWTTMFEGRPLLVETIRPQRSVAIFGGGNDVVPLLRLSSEVGWKAVQYAPATMHPEQLRRRDLDDFDAAVIMTHHFLHDATLLALLLPSPIPYVGLLGPRARGRQLIDEIGPALASFAPRLHNPIGLDLGGETPEEIALSIIAEIQSVLNGRDAGALGQRRQAIHASTGYS